jgi:hypothetical protein
MEHLKSRLLNSALSLTLLLQLPLLTTANANAKPHHLPRQPGLSVSALRTEYKEDPLGIDATRPRLSWQIHSLPADERGVTQSAFQVRVALSLRELQLGKNLVWDSGQVKSDDSIQQLMAVHHCGPDEILLAGACLNREGQASEWSAIANWEMGLLALPLEGNLIEPGLLDDPSKSGRRPCCGESSLNGVVEARAPMSPATAKCS